MLTEPQKETLELIKKYFKQYNRPPRLKEYALELKITNKAILDRLKNLEKEGLILIPDGVLSIKIKEFENDIFISYSKKDQQIAERIFDYFEAEGFKVWKDNMKIEMADNFISKIFDNIRSSKIFLLLLSKDSLESKFVREEVGCAKVSEISNERPLIIPLKIKENFENSDLFSEISHIQMLKIKENFDEEELIKLANKIQIEAYNHENINTLDKKSLTGFIEKANSDLKGQDDSKSLQEGRAFYEIEIFPLMKNDEKDNAMLSHIINKSTVRIQGWGGGKFPASSAHALPKPMQGWIKYIQREVSDENETIISNYWALDKHLHFFNRSALREPYRKTLRNDLKDKVSIEWLMLDIVRPLIFLKKLMETTNIRRWSFRLEYFGLRGKKLAILSKNRFNFFRDYEIEEDKLKYELEIDQHKNLKQIAFEICYDFLTMFDWRNIDRDTLQKDIDTLYDEERFPD